MNFHPRPYVDHRVLRYERRIARHQRRMMRHHLRMRRHQLRMLKHQRRLNGVLGGGAMAVPTAMNRVFGPTGMFGPAGMFGSGGMFGHRGIFGAGSRRVWRRRPRRLFPVLLGLLFIGIATAVMSARGQRPEGNWISV
jgi:hypothetical protein